MVGGILKPRRWGRKKNENKKKKYRGSPTTVLWSGQGTLAYKYYESDAEIVVKWVMEGGHGDTVCGMILADIDALRMASDVLIVACTPRKANQVAHGLAKQALKNCGDFFWIEEFPLCVARAIQDDMPV
ncbi:hypothetical protein LWI29_032829 [Acer saccharum]|uniref:RNase H type-1 domain-containing protein n=1 Tax=Acer saccharum TaxID=4024 RepID=A0AA39VG84_ACESA|nr:hypothetical protein LWI29_032829 [Acer saccharum]